jgi:hypothetical protein
MEHPLVQLREAVGGKAVKECAVCGVAKEYSQFFKDKNSGFREYKGQDDDTGVSEDCRACRHKKKQKEHEEWLKSRGIKPVPKTRI